MLDGILATRQEVRAAYVDAVLSRRTECDVSRQPLDRGLRRTMPTTGALMVATGAAVVFLTGIEPE